MALVPSTVDTIRGHSCEGWRSFAQASARSFCVPRITDHGYVEGCDDMNPIPVLFCPFCGETLPPASEALE